MARVPARVFLGLQGSFGELKPLPTIAAAASPKLEIITAAAALTGSIRATIASVQPQKYMVPVKYFFSSSSPRAMILKV